MDPGPSKREAGVEATRLFDRFPTARTSWRGWQQKLLKKSRELLKLDTKKRHRLRLLNKKLTYSVEFFEDLFADKRFRGNRLR